MTARRSYAAAHAQWVAEQRRKNPELAALWGHTTTADPALEAAAIAAFGRAPTSEAERYAAEQALDARPSGVKGRGED